ncbi:hypothetical protein ACVILK_005309 [Bradyrhizobium embrapense]
MSAAANSTDQKLSDTLDAADRATSRGPRAFAAA